MWCSKFNCTISIEACIKRQNTELKKHDLFKLSLNSCENCKLGKQIAENPKSFLNRDYKKLKEKYPNEIDIKTLINHKKKENNYGYYSREIRETIDW